MKRLILAIASTALLFFAGGMLAGLLLGQNSFFSDLTSVKLISPITSRVNKESNLNQFAIRELKNYPYTTAKLKLSPEIKSEAEYEEQVFTYLTTGKTMSGLLTKPKTLAKNPEEQKIVIMIRGYVPIENYLPGTGTSPVARFLAQRGYLTLAPDFFGFGSSDSEPTNTWEARFIKPVNVIELIKNLKEYGLPEYNIPPKAPLYIWAHSNGGQIALSVLEGTSLPIPTTLWAPVTAPFPYSILFFGDELEDEGKQQRQYLNLFEKNYNAFDFSLTKNLDLLTGPLQIHHGNMDEAALKTWSDEFVEKLDIENQRRQDTLQKNELSKPIKYQYFVYQGADHNLQPQINWNLAINRDLSFFSRY